MAEIGSLAVRLGLDNKDFKKGISDSKKEVGNFNKDLMNLAGTIGIAFGINEVVQFGKELFLLGETASRVTKTFNNFDNSKRLMDDLKTSTGNTVSELKLMQLAINARNFKIPLEQLGKLLQFATIRAAETGQEVDYLTESIILGISRKSIPILDNLGLSAQEIQKEFQKTGDFATAVGNIIDRDMGSAALTIDEAAKKSSQLSAEWKDFKVITSEFVSGPGNDLVNFTTLFVRGLKDVTEELKPFKDEIYDLMLAVATGGSTLGTKLGGMFADFLKGEGDGGAVGSGPTLNLEDTVASTKNVIDTLREVKERLKEIEQEASILPKGSKLAALNQEARDLNKQLEELKNFGLGIKIPAFEGKELKGVGVDTEIKAPDMTAKVQGVNTALAETDHWGHELARTFSNVEEVFINMSNVMEAFGTEVLTGFADEIGNALSGVDNFGDGTLKAMSGFMGAFGKQLIALGIAKAGLDKLFTTGPVGAGVAIAAGVALVAASKALSNSASRSVSAISSAGGGGMSSGGTYGMRQQSNHDQKIVIEGKIRGRDIEFALAKQKYISQRGG